MDDEERTAEDIVAAFRSRKGQPPGTSQATPQPVPPPRAPPPAHAPPMPAPASGPAPPPPPPRPPTAAPGPAAAPASASAPEPTTLPAVAMRSDVTHRPAVQGASSLAAAAPALGLADRLLADRFVGGRGHRGGVMAGVAMALLGVFLLIVQSTGVPGWRTPRLEAYGAGAGFTLLALGLAAAVLFSFVPRARHVQVRFAATQREEWARIQHESKRLQTLTWVGLAAVAGGLVLAGTLRAGLLVLFGLTWLTPLAIAALGAVVLAWVAARRSLLQRLYVQTLVLSRLEHTGLGPAGEPDARVAPVLRSLDHLLGALPESAVRRFLASDEATAYLELMDELEGKRRG